MDSIPLLTGLLPSLTRLICTMAFALLIANVIELLQWTKPLARLAAPLTRFAHLQNVAGASFATAFFSSYTSNALLAESYARKEISKKELIVANLFNSSPTYLVHLPTLFFISYSFLGMHAFSYVGVTFVAALMRTAATALYGHFYLPALQQESSIECKLENKERPTWRYLLKESIRRIKRRLWRLLKFTIPIYCIVYIMQKAGLFQQAEVFIAEYFSWLTFLKPQMIGIITLHLAAEASVALSAASSLLAGGGMQAHELILALLIGNAFSSPMRALRHQLPSYAGYFPADMAVTLVVSNQTLRCISVVLCTFIYWVFYF